MKSLFWLFLLVQTLDGQTLQRRTEPKLQEESCRDHLMRLQRDMWVISMEHSFVAGTHKDFFVARADHVMEAKDFQPSLQTCTKRFLKTADLLAATWALKLAEAREDWERRQR